MEKIAEFLAEVVVEASKLITEEFVISAKDDKGDLVTNFDYEVEKFIIDKINRAYPNYKIISEEFNSSEVWSDNFFTIDPIDGTINFAHNLPFWAIQVACVSEGKLCASVIYLPTMNELYVADSSGSYLNGERIKVSDIEAKKCLYSIEAKEKEALKCIEKMETPYPLQRKFYCAALEFAYVACGKLGGISIMCDTIWDYLPGCLLVEKAGGKIVHENRLHIAACSDEMVNMLYNCCK